MLPLYILLSVFFLCSEGSTGFGKPDSVEILIWSGGSWAGFTHGDTFPAPNYLGHTVDKKAWNCPVECKYTTDKNRAANVDAVIFEGQPLTGYFDDYKRAPPQMPPKFGDQWWVNYGYETPVYFNIYADHGYMDFIDVNFTYYMHSQVPITFTCLWGGGERDDFLKPPPPKSKDKCVAFMATNCGSGGATYRTAYVKELMSHMKLDSLGQCLHNTDLPKEMQFPIYSDHGSSMRNKIAIFKDYKFVLCFENNNITDYVTEKLPNVLQAGSVPVYMGADNVHPFWTPGENSVVETRNFKGPADLAQYLTKMCEDDEEYNKFFDWKKKGLSSHFSKRLDECVFYGAECRLCEYLAAERKKLPERNRKTIASRKSGNYEYNYIQLEGSNYLEVKHNELLDLTTDMTLSAWIKIKQLDVPIIDGVHYRLSIKTVWKRGYVELCVKDTCYMGSHPIVIDSWYHIAVTFKYDEGTNAFVKFFVNGVMDDVVEIPVSHPEIDDYKSVPLLIGTNQKKENFFIGFLDDISIWSVALEDDKARKLSFSLPTGLEEGLIGFLSFNHPQASEIPSSGKAKLVTTDGNSVKFHEGLTKPLVTVNPCL